MRYKGFHIYECERTDGQHSGRWIIQTFHFPTRIPNADELCPHYATQKAAKEAITRGDLQPSVRD